MKGSQTVVPEIRIESLTELEQFKRCVEIQHAVWGYQETDMIPRRMFHAGVAHWRTGAGRVRRRMMVGFAMALPGVSEWA